MLLLSSTILPDALKAAAHSLRLARGVGDRRGRLGLSDEQTPARGQADRAGSE